MIQIDRYGPPEVLTWSERALAPLAPDEVRLRTLFAAVNHTDLEIRAGNWPIRKPQPFPYVPGVEVVGTIEEVGSAVSRWVPGQRAITMMQGLGGVRAERPGGYADHVTVAAEALAPVPPGVDPASAAALGLVGVTAFEGLRRIGPLDGREILVTGAAGGVGSAATAIARAQGAQVTGLVTRADHVDIVRGLGARDLLIAARGEAADLPLDRFDGVLDTVGGASFSACVKSLRPNGTLSLVGAVAGGDVAFDGWDLIRPVTLTGYSTEDLDGAKLRAAVEPLMAWLASGAISAPGFTVIPLREAARAHRLLEQRAISGRVLLDPAAGR